MTHTSHKIRLYTLKLSKTCPQDTQFCIFHPLSTHFSDGTSSRNHTKIVLVAQNLNGRPCFLALHYIVAFRNSTIICEIWHFRIFYILYSLSGFAVPRIRPPNSFNSAQDGGLHNLVRQIQTHKHHHKIASHT